MENLHAQTTYDNLSPFEPDGNICPHCEKVHMSMDEEKECWENVKFNNEEDGR
jgi:hypothetical protein